MKVTLHYDLPTEQEEYESAMNGARFQYAISQVWERVFRPRHKHGFVNEELNKLIESSDDVNRAIDLLEEIYREEVLSDIEDIL